MVVFTKAFFGQRVSYFGLFFVIILIIAPLIGSTRLDWRQAFDFNLTFSENRAAQTLFMIRLPRVLMAGLAGAVLALSGLIFQALLRNPLADPFTLGISSGASLGAVLALKLGLTVSFLGFSSLTIAAFLGAGMSILLVFALARLVQTYFAPMTLILAGISISFSFSAMILLVHYLADFTETFQMIRWMMGGVDIVNYSLLTHLLPICLLGFSFLFFKSRDFNVLSGGEEFAIARGVAVQRLHRQALGITSLLTGLVVSVCGPIGFVGLMVPHVLRLLVGSDHRLLIPATIFSGAGFLIICDTIARVVIAPAELPVGVLTALLGGPFFIWLLLHKRQMMSQV
ncbi:iron ABC transporter permease [candidate division KSB1 bacterium]|nr:iron ABC transporter permease [candidate division KSB1 bacterium]